jgi:fumarylacetoacetase
MQPSLLRSWVTLREDTGFPLENLPWGVFSTPDRDARIGVALGDHIIDVRMLAEHGFLGDCGVVAADLAAPRLNRMLEGGKGAARALRTELQRLFSAGCPDLRDRPDAQHFLVLQAEATMRLPVDIGDYTDFYSSEDHARNVGMMFRDPERALLPNWKHLPVGYHGRASSIVVSGTPVRRPWGQTSATDDGPPTFQPSRLLDFELEMAFITFGGPPLGEPIPIDRAEDYIFGCALFNDWSARDIQKWEYVPLGPFLAKNFASSMAPWIVTLDALAPFRIAGPAQSPEVLPYLATSAPAHFDVDLDVELTPAGGKPHRISRSNLKHLYWSMPQQLAHHTVGGCNIRPGDCMASGTISGPDPGSYGSLLELSWRGTRPLDLGDGTTRTFLADGDTLEIHGCAIRGPLRVSFGSVSGTVLPART